MGARMCSIAASEAAELWRQRNTGHHILAHSSNSCGVGRGLFWQH